MAKPLGFNAYIGSLILPGLSLEIGARKRRRGEVGVKGSFATELLPKIWTDLERRRQVCSARVAGLPGRGRILRRARGPDRRSADISPSGVNAKHPGESHFPCLSVRERELPPSRWLERARSPVCRREERCDVAIQLEFQLDCRARRAAFALTSAGCLLARAVTKQSIVLDRHAPVPRARAMTNKRMKFSDAGDADDRGQNEKRTPTTTPRPARGARSFTNDGCGRASALERLVPRRKNSVGQEPMWTVRLRCALRSV